jgi:hypothetical protein
VGEGGDVLDITNLLIDYDGGVDDLADFVQFVQDGANTVVQVNADGAGGDSVIIAVLQNVTAASVSLIDNVVANGSN